MAGNIFKHGKSRTREYRSWVEARQRCFKVRHPAYKNYGGRGITMCDRWRESFEAFLEDMGQCPAGLSIERIDNDGPYAPGNCEWASRKKQANNRRSVITVTRNGETHSIAEWAKLTGITFAALKHRYQRGSPLFDDERSGRVFTVEFNGEHLPLRELSERTGISVNTLKDRRRRGMPILAKKKHCATCTCEGHE